MIIPAIGKQKISYKDHATVNFESLEFYLDLAQKVIAKMGPTFFQGLSKEMLKNEDAIAFVANAIMMGDWRWKESPDQKNKSLYSYRNQCAIWAIKTYVTKQYKNKHSKKKIQTKYSLNFNENDLSLENIIGDDSQNDPLDVLIENEEHKISKNLIDSLFDGNLLSDKQKKHMKMYYFDNMTLEEIGKKHGVTREAVRQSIKTALEKIRGLV